MAAPLCIFWMLWLERNRVVFENEPPSAHRMKSFFLFSLWSWAKLYSVENLDSLVGFLSWMGIGEWEPVFPCSLLFVLREHLVLSFLIYTFILLLTDQKKIKKNMLNRQI